MVLSTSSLSSSGRHRKKICFTIQPPLHLYDRILHYQSVPDKLVLLGIFDRDEGDGYDDAAYEQQLKFVVHSSIDNALWPRRQRRAAAVGGGRGYLLNHESLLKQYQTLCAKNLFRQQSHSNADLELICGTSAYEKFLLDKLEHRFLPILINLSTLYININTHSSICDPPFHRQRGRKGEETNVERVRRLMGMLVRQNANSIISFALLVEQPATEECLTNYYCMQSSLPKPDLPLTAAVSEEDLSSSASSDSGHVSDSGGGGDVVVRVGNFYYDDHDTIDDDDEACDDHNSTACNNTAAKTDNTNVLWRQIIRRSTITSNTVDKCLRKLRNISTLCVLPMFFRSGVRLARCPTKSGGYGNMLSKLTHIVFLGRTCGYEMNRFVRSSDVPMPQVQHVTFHWFEYRELTVLRKFFRMFPAVTGMTTVTDAVTSELGNCGCLVLRVDMSPTTMMQEEKVSAAAGVGKHRYVSTVAHTLFQVIARNSTASTSSNRPPNPLTVALVVYCYGLNYTRYSKFNDLQYVTWILENVIEPVLQSSFVVKFKIELKFTRDSFLMSSDYPLWYDVRQLLDAFLHRCTAWNRVEIKLIIDPYILLLTRYFEMGDDDDDENKKFNNPSIFHILENCRSSLNKNRAEHSLAEEHGEQAHLISLNGNFRRDNNIYGNEAGILANVYCRDMSKKNVFRFGNQKLRVTFHANNGGGNSDIPY